MTLIIVSMTMIIVGMTMIIVGMTMIDNIIFYIDMTTRANTGVAIRFSIGYSTVS